MSNEQTLTRDELKGIMGGNTPGTGTIDDGDTKDNCIACVSESGMSSCWFTKDSPSSLCERVYPGQSGSWYMVGCDGCVMG
ncbi:hypothetical protein [Sphingobacterium sp. xlx-130]|uniref:hypothetical protein n=1 Tax=Sphingobacterium sp. xlx-130 TaxID=2654323 RepID=UPI0013DD03BC|nr:hypothetical protein [Sphingobacterium sp. xlx-130]